MNMFTPSLTGENVMSDVQHYYYFKLLQICQSRLILFTSFMNLIHVIASSLVTDDISQHMNLVEFWCSVLLTLF